MGLPYADNSVPFGSRSETIKRGGTAQPTEIGEYVLEHISLTRPAHKIQRKDQVNRPNGFVLTEDFDHGTAVIQIPTGDSPYPQRGDWFQDTFSTGETETWVIGDVTEPYAQADYFKANITLHRATNPPA